MTSIMKFMAAYPGQFHDWDEAMNSKVRMYPHYTTTLGIGPEVMNWNTPPPVMTNDAGYYPPCRKPVSPTLYSSRVIDLSGSDSL